MSLAFAESNQEYLHIPAETNLLAAFQAISVTCWIKPTTLTGSSTALNAWTKTGTVLNRRQVLLRFSDANLQCFVHNGTSQYGGNVGKTGVTGAWQHIGLTYDGGTLTGYLNGLAGGTTYSASGSLQNTSNNLGLGTYGTSSYLDGNLEDRAIWNRALSAEEIKSMYQARVRAGFFPEGLIQWWPLDVPGDGIYDAFADGDYGGRDLTGTLPAQLGTAPDWSEDSPGLHWPTRPILTPFVGAGARRVAIGTAFINRSRVVLVG